MRKYFVRAVKYFFWFALILVLIMVVLSLAGIVGTDPKEMFRDGYNSLWQIAALFAAVAALYPRFGFITKSVIVPEGIPDPRETIVRNMESRGYTLRSETGGVLVFRLRSKVSAAFKMFEDGITLTPEDGGYSVEGLTKEVVRVVSALEYSFRGE